MESKKIYYGFDILKFLMALLIVATHSSLFVEFEQVYPMAQVFYSLAVPTFFAISTFIYGKKIIAANNHKSAWKICKRDTIRLIQLAMFWIIVDFPMTYDSFYSIASWKEILYALAFTDPIRGLWFIKALIINKMLIFLFRNDFMELMVISLICFIVFSLGYTEQFGGFSHLLHPYFNFYFHTFFCCIGVLFAKIEDINRFRIDYCALLLAFAFLMTFYNPDYGIILWRIVCPFFFMALFIQIGRPVGILKSGFLYMRKVSILFYFLHFNFLWIYEKVFYLNEISPFGISSVRFSIVLMCCIIFSMIILNFEQDRRLSFLKYSH